MHSWRWSSSSHHPVTALRYRGPLWIWRGVSLIVVSGPWLMPGQLSFMRKYKERGSATRPVAIWAQKVSGSQLLTFRLGFLCVSGPFLLAHSTLQFCQPALQERPGGLGQRVLLTLGDMDWVLVHQDWFLHIRKVTYSSQTTPPMVKAHVLTVGHEG